MTPKQKDVKKKDATNATKLARKVRSLERARDKQERQIEDLQKAVHRLQEIVTGLRHERIA